LSDAGRISGGDIIGMIEPVGLSGGCEEDWKLSLRFCCRWRRNTIKQARITPTRTTIITLMPIATGLESPWVAPLDDAAEPAEEEGALGSGTGFVGFEGSSVVDVDDPEVGVLVSLLTRRLVGIALTAFEIVLALLEVLETAPTLPELDVKLGVTGSDVEPGSDVGLTVDVGGSEVELVLSAAV